MVLAIKSRNSMDRGILGLNLGSMPVWLGLRLQVQIMLEKRLVLLAFVNRDNDSDHGSLLPLHYGRRHILRLEAASIQRND